MIRIIVLSPSPALAACLRRRIDQSGSAVIVKEFHRYPAIEELAGSIRAHDPQAVFVDVATDASAVRVAGEMQLRWPLVAFVAMDESPDPAKLVNLIRSGVREFIASPFSEEEFYACVDRVRSHAHAAVSPHPHGSGDRITNAVYAFVPAKPGTGASTLAIDTAFAFSRLENNRTLLVDFDLGCGVTRFHLKADHPYSVQDALERASVLEPGVWADLAAPCSGLDLLATAPPGPGVRPPAASVAPLFEFARRHYDSIILDCSGDLDAFTMEVLSQCRRILLVAEPDMTTVHMGREKLRILRSEELEDRVELVINRWRKQNMLSLADIEGVLGVAADHLVPDDPKSAYQCVLRGSGADPLSPLGKACGAISDALGAPQGLSLQTVTAAPTEGARKRMVEYFAISPARYSIFPNGSTSSRQS